MYKIVKNQNFIGATSWQLLFPNNNWNTKDTKKLEWADICDICLLKKFNNNNNNKKKKTVLIDSFEPNISTFAHFKSTL